MSAPAPPERKASSGWRIVAAKEIADHLRSVRFTILTALLGLGGIGAVYAAASGIRTVAVSASRAPDVFLRMFTLAPERIPPFYTVIGLMGPLLGIAFGFDAVNGERSQGTLPRLISQPIYRDDVINGKFVAGFAVVGVVLTTLVAVVTGFGLARVGVVPDLADVVRLVMYVLVSLLYLGFWLALSTMFSVMLRRAATSALASLAVWLVVTLFGSLLSGLAADALAPVPADATIEEELRNATMRQTISRISPTTLYEEATFVLLSPLVRTLGFVFPEQLEGAIPTPLRVSQSLALAAPQVIGLGAFTILAFVLSYLTFMRQEVRA